MTNELKKKTTSEVENKEKNEFDIKAELEAKRKEIKTFEDLTAFLEDVKNNYNIGYGEAPRAMAQAALATVDYLCGEFGITGFQAGCVMWDFIRGWMYRDNKCGMRMVNFDDMLFPQYEYKYEKTIPLYVWEHLQKEAKKNLEEAPEYVHPNVIAHWQSIVDGNVPFGYTVTDD